MVSPSSSSKIIEAKIPPWEVFVKTLAKTNEPAFRDAHFSSFCGDYKAAIDNIKTSYPLRTDGLYYLNNLPRSLGDLHGLLFLHNTRRHDVFLKEVSLCPICMIGAIRKAEQVDSALKLIGDRAGVSIIFPSWEAQDQHREEKKLASQIMASQRKPIVTSKATAITLGDSAYDSESTEADYVTPNESSDEGSVCEDAQEPPTAKFGFLSELDSLMNDSRIVNPVEGTLQQEAADMEAARIAAEQEKARRMAEAQARKNAEAEKVGKRKAKNLRYKANKRAEAGGTKSENESDDKNSTYDLKASRSERDEIIPSLDTQGSVAQTITPLLSPANSNYSITCEDPSDPLPQISYLHISNPPKLPPWPPKEPEIIAPFKRSQTTPALGENFLFERAEPGDGSSTPQPIEEKPQVRRTTSFSWNYDPKISTATGSHEAMDSAASGSNVTLSEATSISFDPEDASDLALLLALLPTSVV